MAEAIDPWANCERLPHPRMMPGNAAATRVRLIVWCRERGHHVEPDPDREGPAIRCRNARLARAAGLLEMRQPTGGHGRDRNGAAVAPHYGGKLMLAARLPRHSGAARTGPRRAVLFSKAQVERRYGSSSISSNAPYSRSTRIEDLGPGDFVKVDCAACHHVALLTPEALLRAGLSRAAKVLGPQRAAPVSRVRGWFRSSG